MLQFDTAMHRLTVLEMTPEQLELHVASMRVRRMASQVAYKEATEAKERLKGEKDAVALVKRLEQLDKAFETYEKLCDKIDKYHTDIKVLRMSLGDRL